jgi:hypothetical protein
METDICSARQIAGAENEHSIRKRHGNDSRQTQRPRWIAPWALTAFLVACAISSGPWMEGRAAAQCRAIDDFSVGGYGSTLSTPNARTTNGSDKFRFQTGTTILGARRDVEFAIAGNPFGLTGELSIAGIGGGLVIGSGTRQFFRLDVLYGDALNAPLDYHPTGCDRFRVTFDSSSQQALNLTIEVYQPGGPNYSDGINLFPTAAGQPFCVDFPFDQFVTNAGPILQSFASQGVSMLDLIAQSGAAVGANSFAITRFETVGASAAPCPFVARNR